MSRNLMPKSGAMAPYVVVNRDAAVAGVFSVDGEAGAVVLTSKYLQISKYTADKAVTDASITSINESIGNINTALGGINTSLSNKAAKGANNDITELNALTKAITLAQGGTGAATLDGAKQALQVERLRQQDNGTFVVSPDGKYSFFIYNSGDFGLIDSATAAVSAMKVAFGGTGGTTPKDARKSLNIPVGALAELIPNGENILNYVAVAGQSGYYSSGELVVNGPPKQEGWWTYNFHCHGVDINGAAQYGVLRAVGLSGSSWINVLDGTGNWRGWQEQFNMQSTIPLTKGGTGATSVESAKINFGIDRFKQSATETMMYAPGVPYRITSRPNGEWGCWRDDNGSWIPLSIAAGGTGATTVAQAATNLSLGRNNQVYFDSVYCPEFKVADWTYAFAARINGGSYASWRSRPTALSIDGQTTDVAISIFKCTIPAKGYPGSLDAVLWNNGSAEMRLNVGGTPFTFTSSGQATATQWVSTSDIRLKANLNKIQGASEKIESLTGYTYYKRSTFEENEYTTYNIEAGLIAQDLETVLPEAVYSLDTSGKADPKGTAIKGISYGGVVALLVNGFKEQRTIIGEQDRRVTSLEKEIDELKKLVKQLLDK
ncbi:tail fiber domain-containing protein [Salmonella enterica]|nr:tail fiber domain-containing protein [Salmonella enterica]EJP0906869.1 tail fiber domain-containing protein [Salmonella enterica]EJP1088650.1 tail fiber domain-containing protein [Salmonella enterica]